ncbi:DNA polymerase III subunit chi [Desulfacinum hydrothermale]|nr:DNA polymerase III subunit chi [Desulfacinum hydrothermale]
MIFVETTARDQRRDLCRWAEYFAEKGKKVLVLTDSSLGAQHLDKLLWSFSQPSFVPHRIVAEADLEVSFPEPVLIAVDPRLPLPADVVLCDAFPDLDALARYPAILHFVPLDDEERKQDSRRLWLEAKARGVELKHAAATHRGSKRKK